MKKLSLVYLAAGFSKRFGSNKLLALYNNVPLFSYGLNALVEAEKCRGFCDEIIVVTQYEEIISFIKQMNVPEGLSIQCVFNPNSSQGISSSIKCGITESTEGFDGCMFLVADQPHITAATINGMIEQFEKVSSKIICCSALDSNEYANPVIFPAEFKKELLLLEGDKGGKCIIKKHPEVTERFYVKNQNELTDVDLITDIS